MDSSIFEHLQVTLGHEFKDHDLLDRAVSHASGTDHRLQSNERMESDGELELAVARHCEALGPRLRIVRSWIVGEGGGCRGG